MESLSAQDEAAFRRAYEELVESGQAREQLVAVAQDQCTRRFGPTEEAAASSPRWEVFATNLSANGHQNSFEGEQRLVSFEQGQICMIGKQGYGNDMEFRNGGSRVHTILLPVGDQLFVCDVGGRFGFDIIERSTRAANAPPLPADHSRPGQRRVLRVGAQETAVLNLRQSRRIVINPKECAVCFGAPREIHFSECGHFVCCRSCSLRLNRCPLCRTQLNRPARAAAHAHSAPAPHPTQF